jgi:hypothetical protein
VKLRDALTGGLLAILGFLAVTVPGTYAADAAKPSPALAVYRQHRATLKPGRLDIPRRVPPLCGHNLWDSNMPAATLRQRQREPSPRTAGIESRAARAPAHWRVFLSPETAPLSLSVACYTLIAQHDDKSREGNDEG